MTPDHELLPLLDRLIAGWESEVVEFKNVSDSFSTSDIGKYFSALANEANLRNLDRAWLIFGVDDKTRRVLGSTYRADPDRLNRLKLQISRDTEPGVTFREIHVLDTAAGRVLMFEIPAAPVGIPIAWKGHYHARAGESLTHLGLDKLDAIRAQTAGSDWSAAIVEGATLAHLDPAALLRARADFARKYANRFPEKAVAAWPDEVFLDRAKLTVDGKLTRTTLLLLGKAEASPLLTPHPAQITWRLEGQEKAYQHFGPPFLLSTSALYQMIRNIQIRILPDDQLLAVEVAKYDQKIVLEALHNCIAHQDYTRLGRIVVTELPDQLVFENEGSFFEGQPVDYLTGHKTPRRYRNPFLAQAMVELNMIDTMGYGIHEIYAGQARRFLPMPDYDLSNPGAVKMVLHGRIVDPAYSRVLIQRTDLPLADVLALDRVQKGLPLEEDAVRRLKRAKLIEGRKPHYHVSAAIASAAETKAAYNKTRALDDNYYRKLVTEYLEKFGGATRADLDQLLRDKLSDALDDSQKETKISYLVTSMRRMRMIHNTAARKTPCWVLVKPPSAE
ncbi:MAG: putative DNA binding domain-containing protein [Verrucomicrobia bacterium]|nr:putative DNA binding domain-containing protein [Verrucomicrobiota bacterium]